MNKNLRKVSRILHLYLTELSCIVVFIVCITGCIYVFKNEITDWTQPWKFITPQEKAVLLPTEILAISNQEVPSVEPSAITYGEPFDAVFVDYFSKTEGMSTVYINQYTGQVIKTIVKKPDDFDFFKFILSGHRSLWLPPKIGKPIVGYGVLCFAIILITGIILWWPKKWDKAAIKRSFTLKKKASFLRKNLDLHKVLGIYSVPILLILSLTGLIWSFNWFSNSVYYATSGGKKLTPYTLPKSEVKSDAKSETLALDQLFIQLKKEEPHAKTFYYALPYDSEGVIRVSIVHERGSYYKTDNLFFDQYTLKSLQGSGPYAGKYTEVSSADQLRRMNYDIHTGQIFGLFGKIVVFIAGLIGASLPVTGFIIWYRKKKQ